MKLYIITILMLVYQLGLAQKRERVEFKIDDLYQGVYSEVYEQPLEVTYTVKCPNGQASRTGMDFFTDGKIHTSDNDDYSNNVWDKGHLAPAAAFSCTKETLKKTFSYLNSALQHEGLNRGQWNQLESFERDLANFYEVKVKIVVLFEGKLTVLPSGATVPSGFVKIIEFNGQKHTFNFPNIDTKGTDWIDYKVN
jgi:DNA/RNA endonuclease G (NUC1)